MCLSVRGEEPSIASHKFLQGGSLTNPSTYLHELCFVGSKRHLDELIEIQSPTSLLKAGEIACILPGRYGPARPLKLEQGPARVRAFLRLNCLYHVHDHLRSNNSSMNQSFASSLEACLCTERRVAKTLQDQPNLLLASPQSAPQTPDQALLDLGRWDPRPGSPLGQHLRVRTPEACWACALKIV